MQEINAQEILTLLIDQAQEEHTEFHIITTWAEFKYYWRQEKATKVVIKLLRNSANFVFNSYCKAVASGSADFNLLLAYSQLQDVVAYYEQELKIISDMTNEYDDYLVSNNFIFTLIGAMLGAERDI